MHPLVSLGAAVEPLHFLRRGLQLSLALFLPREASLPKHRVLRPLLPRREGHAHVHEQPVEHDATREPVLAANIDRRTTALGREVCQDELRAEVLRPSRDCPGPPLMEPCNDLTARLVPLHDQMPATLPAQSLLGLFLLALDNLELHILRVVFQLIVQIRNLGLPVPGFPAPFGLKHGHGPSLFLLEFQNSLVPCVDEPGALASALGFVLLPRTLEAQTRSNHKALLPLLFQKQRGLFPRKRLEEGASADAACKAPALCVDFLQPLLERLFFEVAAIAAQFFHERHQAHLEKGCASLAPHLGVWRNAYPRLAVAPAPASLELRGLVVRDNEPVAVAIVVKCVLHFVGSEGERLKLARHFCHLMCCPRGACSVVLPHSVLLQLLKFFEDLCTLGLFRWNRRSLCYDPRLNQFPLRFSLIRATTGVLFVCILPGLAGIGIFVSCWSCCIRAVRAFSVPPVSFACKNVLELLESGVFKELVVRNILRLRFARPIGKAGQLAISGLLIFCKALHVLVPGGNDIIKEVRRNKRMVQIVSFADRLGRKARLVELQLVHPTLVHGRKYRLKLKDDRFSLFVLVELYVGFEPAPQGRHSLYDDPHFWHAHRISFQMKRLQLCQL
mmetsp:Transcript_24925/g.70503  ORF Transcript_24925/g.70503 Transcript_24925/m.70503 type:complete len:616 (-) Transcript_24925:665-2512(-)